jgi:hypothetical protein
MTFGYHPNPPRPSPSYPVSNLTDVKTKYGDFKFKFKTGNRYIGGFVDEEGDTDE